MAEERLNRQLAMQAKKSKELNELNAKNQELNESSAGAACIILPSRSSQLVQFIRSAIRNPLNPQSPPVIAICRKLVPWQRDWHKSSTRQVNSIRPRCGVAFVTIGPWSEAEAELMKLKQTRQDLEDFFGSHDVGPRLTRLLIPTVLLHRSRYSSCR